MEKRVDSGEAAQDRSFAEGRTLSTAHSSSSCLFFLPCVQVTKSGNRNSSNHLEVSTRRFSRNSRVHHFASTPTCPQTPYTAQPTTAEIDATRNLVSREEDLEEQEAADDAAREMVGPFEEA